MTERLHFHFHKYCWASLVVQMVEYLPAMQEIHIQSLGRDDPLKCTATHSSILARRIQWTEEPSES